MNPAPHPLSASLQAPHYLLHAAARVHGHDDAGVGLVLPSGWLLLDRLSLPRFRCSVPLFPFDVIRRNVFRLAGGRARYMGWGTMNTNEMAEVHWGEEELRMLVAAFVRCHRRTPSLRELERFRRERGPFVAA